MSEKDFRNISTAVDCRSILLTRRLLNSFHSKNNIYIIHGESVNPSSEEKSLILFLRINMIYFLFLIN